MSLHASHASCSKGAGTVGFSQPNANMLTVIKLNIYSC